MLVAVVILAVVAAAAIVAALISRAKFVAERDRAAAAEAASTERAAELTSTRDELTTTRDELTGARDELSSTREALETETDAHTAAAERTEQLQVDLAAFEQRAADAEQRARDAAAATGVESGVVWPLELQRSERVWRFSVSPGPHSESPFTTTAAPLITALEVEVDAARNDIGADVELAADLPPDVEPAAAMLVVRVAQELLASVARRSETATLRVNTDGDDIVVALDAVDGDGEPVLPEPLPLTSALIEPIDTGVRLAGCARVTEQRSDHTEE